MAVCTWYNPLTWRDCIFGDDSGQHKGQIKQYFKENNISVDVLNDTSEFKDIILDSKYCDFIRIRISDTENTTLYCGNESMAKYDIDVYELVQEEVINETTGKKYNKTIKIKKEKKKNVKKKVKIKEKKPKKIKVEKDTPYNNNGNIINKEIFDIEKDKIKVYFNFTTQEEGNHIVCVKFAQALNNPDFQFLTEDNLYIGIIDGDYCYGNVSGDFFIDPTFVGSDCNDIQLNISNGNSIQLNGSIAGTCYLNITAPNIYFDGNGYNMSGGIKVTGNNVDVFDLLITNGYPISNDIAGIWADGTGINITGVNMTLTQSLHDGWVRGITSSLSGTQNFEIHNNRIYDFSLSGDTYPLQTSGGIYLSSVDGSNITDNVIENFIGRPGHATSSKTGEGFIGILVDDNSYVSNNNITDISGGAGVNGGNGGIVKGIDMGLNCIIKNNILSNIATGQSGYAILSEGVNGLDTYGFYLNNAGNTIISNNIMNASRGGRGANGDHPEHGGQGGSIFGIYGLGSTDNLIINNNIFYNMTSGNGGTGGTGADPGFTRGIYLVKSSVNITIFSNTFEMFRSGVDTGTFGSCGLYGIQANSSNIYQNILTDFNNSEDAGCLIYGIIDPVSYSLTHWGNQMSVFDGPGAGMSSVYAFSSDGVDEINPGSLEESYLTGDSYLIKWYRSNSIADTTQLTLYYNISGSLTLINNSQASTFCGVAPTVNCTYNWDAPVNGSYLFVNSSTYSTNSPLPLQYGVFTISSRINPTPNATVNQDLLGYCNGSTTTEENLTYYYKWYLNGILNQSGQYIDVISGTEMNVNNISSTFLSIPQNWTLSCLVGTSTINATWLNSTITEIVNGPPTVMPRTYPYPYANDSTNLLGYCNGTDFDNDNLTYYWNWYLNGALNISGTTYPTNYNSGTEVLVSTLGSGNTTVQENWTLGCIAQDPYQNSTEVNITTEINNLPIFLLTNITPDPAYTNDTLYVEINATDDGGGLLTVFINWIVNGISAWVDTIAGIVSGTPVNSTLAPSNFSKGDNVIAEVIVSDGLQNTTPQNTSTLTISDSSPYGYPGAVYFEPIPTTTFDNISGYCNFSDIDNDTLTYDARLYLNDVINRTTSAGPIAQGVPVNVVNISSIETQRLQNWTLSCRATDGVNYSAWVNETIRVNYSIPIINELFITPINPVYTDNLSCNFNASILDVGFPLNVSITWWNSTDGVNWNNVNIYDYDYNNIVFNQRYTTTVGTGSVPALLQNSSIWKCEIDVVNYDQHNIQNSTEVSLNPLIVELFTPLNDTITEYPINATFNATDDDGGINCSLNANGISTVNNSIQSGVITTINYTPPISGYYNWNVSCTAIGNPIPLFTETRFYTYDVAGPTYTNYADDSTSTFPQIGDTIILDVIVSDTTTIDTCKLEINDTGSYVNTSTHIINTNFTYNLSMGYTIQPYSIANNTNITWKVWCNDTFGHVSESAVQNFTVKDTTNPEIIFGPGNNWKNDSTSIISNLLYNLSLNVTFSDNNLFQAFVNITCDIDNIIYYWEILDINTTTYTHTNTSIDLGGLDLQKCNILLGASDDHTAEKIKEYRVEKKLKGLKFETENGANVEVLSIDKGNSFKEANTKRNDDRYSFEFDYNDKQLSRKFKIKTDKIIYPRDKSRYPGHFVVWDEKTKTGNWIDFTEFGKVGRTYKIDKISDYEYDLEISSDIPVEMIKEGQRKSWLEWFGIDKLFFNSIGGTNVFNASYSFYIGGAVNLTGLNIYDNSSIANFTVNVTTINSYPGFNGGATIDGTQEYLENVSNGTYQIDFSHPWYFDQIYTINITNTSQDLIYESFQSVVNIISRNVKTLTILQNVTVDINNTQTGKTEHRNETLVDTNTFYLNASDYTLFLQRHGYQNYSSTFNTTYKQNLTIYADMNFFAVLFLWDERTLEPFNVSSADRINFLVFCPNATYTSVINTSNVTIPITCNYDKFKFVLDYGATSYYRTFILDPDELFHVNIYLINLLTTQSIYNSFIIDDLLGDYDNPRVYVKKNVGAETVQITADWIDIENKIGAYLILNHEYIIEVHSDNQPVRVIGRYSADIPGDKNLRLYDVSLATTTPGYINNVGWWQQIVNISGTSYAVAVYNDSENRTNFVTWSLRRDTSTGPLLYTSTIASSNVEFTVNVSDLLNYTLWGVFTFDHPDLSVHNSSVLLNTFEEIGLLIFDYLGDTDEERQNWLNWFFLIILSVLALYATIRTAKYMAIAVLSFAGLFVLFGWFGMNGGLIWFALLIALLVLLKSGEKDLK